MLLNTAPGRRILEEQFDGNLDAYADHMAGPRPLNVERDSDHPWHRRRALALALVDLPDDCAPAPDLVPVFSRAEVCELLGCSDSGFGRWQVPERGRSGKYVLYTLGDVLAYRQAAAHRSALLERGLAAPSIHELAAAMQAEGAAAAGPIRFWRPGPPGADARQKDLFTNG